MNYHLCAQTKQRWYVVVGSQRRLRHPINYLRENGQMTFFVSFFFENHVAFCDETFKRTPIITRHKFDIFSQTTWFFFKITQKLFFRRMKTFINQLDDFPCWWRDFSWDLFYFNLSLSLSYTLTYIHISNTLSPLEHFLLYIAKVHALNSVYRWGIHFFQGAISQT